MTKVSNYNDKITFRVRKDDKVEAEQILFRNNRSLADYFREQLQELLKRGK